MFPNHKANLSLNLLGRVPVPGAVKTRLIPALGEQGAADAHAVLLTHVSRVARLWSDISSSNRLFRLWGTGDGSSLLLRDLALVDQQRQQPDGDLGARMDWIVRAGLAEAQGVMVLGGDAVSVTQKTLDQAESLLLHHAAVLVPAEDGGYVLLGLRGYAPQLFRDMPWGSSQVAAITRQRLCGLGWSWQEIPGHWDVDSVGDWYRFNSWRNNC